MNDQGGLFYILFWNNTNTQDFNEIYGYDQNGNILSLLRRDKSGGVMDNLSYHYDRENKSANTAEWLVSNRLYDITEAAGFTSVPGDVEFFGAAFDPTNSTMNAANNYSYDAIGNLTRDGGEGIDLIEWNTYGKIKKIRGNGPKDDLEFIYDAMGNRIAKYVKHKTAGVLQPESEWEKTWYVRDASGNVMTTVNNEEINGNPALSYEYGIYGSSRLGVKKWIDYISNPPQQTLAGDYHREYSKQYELSNHLGNVRVIVRGCRAASINNGALTKYPLLVAANDYYPFGMQMPGRSFNSGGYRYGFNGKESDNEVSGTGNQYDYGFRIYNPRLGKFLSVDPLTASYSWLTPFQFAENCPVQFVDIDGLESGWIDNGGGRMYMSTGDIGNVYRKPVVLPKDVGAPLIKAPTQQYITPPYQSPGEFLTRKQQELAINLTSPIDVEIVGKALREEELTKTDKASVVIGILPIGRIGNWGYRGMLKINMLRAGIDLAGKHAHHIITYAAGGRHALSQLAQKAGFDINSVDNGIPLEEKFHIQLEEGNFHREYTKYIVKQLDKVYKELKDMDSLTPENVKKCNRWYNIEDQNKD